MRPASENSAGQPTPYRMLLFVAGEERNSQVARANLFRLNERYFAGKSEIQIVDVLKDYQKALEFRVLLTPTLVLLSPPPPVRVIGTLEDTSRVLTSLRFECEPVER